MYNNIYKQTVKSNIGTVHFQQLHKHNTMSSDQGGYQLMWTTVQCGHFMSNGNVSNQNERNSAANVGNSSVNVAWLMSGI